MALSQRRPNRQVRPLPRGGCKGGTPPLKQFRLPFSACNKNSTAQNFILASTSPPAPPPPKKSLPLLPRVNHGPTPSFFGPNPGLFGSDSGYFGSILGRFLAFPGQNHAVLGPISPSRGAPPPREMCKNFTSQPACSNAPSPPLFPKITQIIGCLSHLLLKTPLSVYR